MVWVSAKDTCPHRALSNFSRAQLGLPAHPTCCGHLAHDMERAPCDPTHSVCQSQACLSLSSRGGDVLALMHYSELPSVAREDASSFLVVSGWILHVHAPAARLVRELRLCFG